MWQLFTERARRVIFFSQEEAQQRRENLVSTEHLLLGLLRLETSVAVRILERAGTSLESIRRELEAQVTHGDGYLGQELHLSLSGKEVIDLAYDEARMFNNNYIGTEHLLLGLIREPGGLAGRVLRHVGVELERIRAEVWQLQANDDVTTDQPMQAN